MDNVKEMERKFSISWGLAAYMVVGLVAATFALTTIYNSFLLMEEKLKEINDHIDYVDKRHDRKYDRLNDDIDEIEDRIKTLELPNSDDSN